MKKSKRKVKSKDEDCCVAGVLLVLLMIAGIIYGSYKTYNYVSKVTPHTGECYMDRQYKFHKVYMVFNSLEEAELRPATVETFRYISINKEDSFLSVDRSSRAFLVDFEYVGFADIEKNYTKVRCHSDLQL